MTKINFTVNLNLIIKLLNIIMITDDILSNNMKSVIVNAVRKLDNCNAELWQIRIQFFQMKNKSETADKL